MYTCVKYKFKMFAEAPFIATQTPCLIYCGSGFILVGFLRCLLVLQYAYLINWEFSMRWIPLSNACSRASTGVGTSPLAARIPRGGSQTERTVGMYTVWAPRRCGTRIRTFNVHGVAPVPVSCWSSELLCDGVSKRGGSTRGDNPVLVKLLSIDRAKRILWLQWHLVTVGMRPLRGNRGIESLTTIAR